MHDIKWIRENPAAFDRRAHAALNVEPERFVADMLLALDESVGRAHWALEGALARRNAASKEIGQAKKKKDDAHGARH